jgi:F0F1-type ATP synthase membrane subunit c/vacuolar-type H+-ATPase subunit K
MVSPQSSREYLELGALVFGAILAVTIGVITTSTASGRITKQECEAYYADRPDECDDIN